LNILITGASGFIGRYLVHKLSQQGHDVVGVHYENSLDISGVTSVCVDLRCITLVKDLFDGDSFDCVVHLGGYIPKPQETHNVLSRCMNVNAMGTYFILKCAYESGVKRVVYTSSSSIYSRREHELSLPINEDSWIQSDSPYALSKYMGEVFAELFTENMNMNVISLRPSSVYGFGQSPYCVLPIFVDSAIKGENLNVWGKGMYTQDFVYVEDVVDAIIKTLTSDVVGVYNIGSGVETSITSLAKMVRRIFNPDIDIVTKLVKNEDTTRFFLDISRARNVLGYQPKYSLESGLRKYKSEVEREK